jgi:hypothetical protein
MSYESTQTRIFLQDYLCNLLVSSKNVLVKIRVLQILVAVLEEGHEEFRTNLRRQPDSLKETSRLRSCNARVLAECGRIRDCANRILDILFNDEWQRPTPQYVPNPPASVETSGAVFPQETKSSGTGFVEGLKSVAEKMKIGYPKSSTLTYDESYASNQSVPFNVQPTPTTTQPYPGMQSVRHSDLPPTEEHVRGRAGGGWAVDTSKPVSTHHEAEKPPPTLARAQQPVKEDTPPSPVSPTSEESRLVDDITAVGGVRMAPSRDQLQVFIRRCKSLDVLTIVDLLRVKLTSDNNSVVLRTLCVFEALLKSDVSEVAQLMDIALEELVQLQSSTQQAIKAKSIKIVRSLGIDSSQMADRSVVKEQVTAQQSSTLFDFTSDDSSTVPTTSQPTNQGTTTNHPSNDLDIFSTLETPSQPPQPQPSTNGGDMASLFGNMQMTGNEQPQTTTIPEENSLMDFGQEDLELDPLAPKRTQSNASGFLTASGNFNFGTVRQSSTSQATATSIQDPLISTPTNNYSLSTAGAGMPYTQTGMLYQPSASGMPMYVQNPTGQTPYYSGAPLATPPQQNYSQVPYPMAGQSRPVQRPPPKTETTTGFGFIDKPKDNNSPFGFIGDEMMKASQKK